MISTDPMPNHFVYILESTGGKFYTGYTTDIDRRMEEHKIGKGSKFVRAFGFKRLLYHEEYKTKPKAMQREREIKNLTRAQKELLVRGETIDYF